MKLPVCSVLLSFTGLASAVTQHDATAAYNSLQQWYNSSIGLWIPSTGWWNSANCLTVIADLAKIDATVAAKAESIYPITWVRAQKYNLQMQKVSNPPMYLPRSFYGGHWPHFPHGWHKPHPVRTNGFLNDYYDDEGVSTSRSMSSESDSSRMVGACMDRSLRCDGQ